MNPHGSPDAEADALRRHNARVVGTWAPAHIAGTAALHGIALEQVADAARQALAEALPASEGAGEGLCTFSGRDRDLETAFAALAADASSPARDPARAALAALAGWRRERFALRLPRGERPVGPRTAIMGIINVTPDSFSDGGQFADRDRAVEHGLALAAAGADILDIGGESTRPGAPPVPPEEQVRRTVPVIRALARQVDIPISIDTTSAVVARQALDAGAEVVNDVSALRGDAAMAALVAARGVPVVLMHMLGTPRTMQKNPRYDDVVADICRFLHERVAAATSAGIAAEQIVVDPGIGFGKNVAQNLEILRRLAEFRSLGLPVLVGTSRKSFIGRTLDAPVDRRVLGTAASLALSSAAGAAAVRVHDVAEARQVVRMADAIVGRDA